MSDLFQFEWLVWTGGYTVREARPGPPPFGKHDGVFPFLVHDGRSESPPKRYNPLVEGGLFRNFAELSATPDAIIEFANLYGMLGGDVSNRVAPPGEDKLIPGERVQRWEIEITRLRRAIEIWEWAKEHRVDQLAPYIRWDPDGRCVWYTSDPEFVKEDDFRPTHDFSVIASDEVRPHLLQLTRDGDLVQPAWYHVQQVVNKALQGNVSPRLLWRANQLGLHNVPRSLLAALWLQFAVAVAGEVRHRRCEHCNKWFELAPGVGRSDKKHCSERCRSAAYRQRKRKQS